MDSSIVKSVEETAEQAAKSIIHIDTNMVFQTLITVILGGLVLKALWNYYSSGRIQVGEYFMSADKCAQNMQNCCVHDIKKVMVERDLVREHDLTELAEKINSLSKDAYDAKKEAKELRQEVMGVRTSIDTLTGMFRVFARTGETRLKDVIDEY